MTLRCLVRAIVIVPTVILVALGSDVALSQVTSPPPGATNAATSRAKDWAVKLDKPGLPNLHQVTTNLYRGAQITPEGASSLKTMGVKTVINLRSFHSDRDELAGTGMRYERFYVKAWNMEDEEAVRFFKIMADTNNLPAFVHCQHGADRTGTMCALYRVAFCGWAKDRAIAEMTNGGFGFHKEWQNLVRYVEQADVESFKRQAGITNRAESATK